MLISRNLKPVWWFLRCRNTLLVLIWPKHYTEPYIFIQNLLITWALIFPQILNYWHILLNREGNNSWYLICLLRHMIDVLDVRMVSFDVRNSYATRQKLYMRDSGGCWRIIKCIFLHKTSHLMSQLMLICYDLGTRAHKQRPVLK